jgi:formylglycine-generating enzyme required for sulfatase activity
MEYVDGESLANLLLSRPGEKLGEKEALDVARKIARGLACAHSNDVIHRDIKPQNILVSKTAEVKILDFGISEIVHTTMSRVDDTAITGSRPYMSPEQIRGKGIGRESDIYSFGVTLYELLCGHPPFSSGDILYQVLNEKPDHISGISPTLNGFLQKCLAKDYEDRYRSFEEVLMAMDQLGAEDPPELPEPIEKKVPTEIPKPVRKKNKGQYAAIVLIILLVAGVIGAVKGGLLGSERVSEPAIETPLPVNANTERVEKKVRLIIKTEPQNATIKVGNQENTPKDIELVTGEYTVTASAAGYETEVRTVILNDDPVHEETIVLKQVKTSEDELQVKDENPTLSVVTDPMDAVVTLMKRKEKFTQGMALKPGIYKISVSAEGYETTVRDVELKPGRNIEVVVSLTKIEDRPVGPAKVVEKKPEPEKTNSIGMKFVYVKPGTFMMGGANGESREADNETRHRVTLSRGYYIQTTEVTQGQWRKVMGDNPSRFKDCGDDCPVDNVNWKDAQSFIQKLNQLDTHGKYRLPTEAEWEYACRAGSDSTFANDNSLDRMGWYNKNSRNGTHPVAQKKPNAWGLYDMHGNVWEWCSDWYGDYPSYDVTDPQGASWGRLRVLRGGGWSLTDRNCRSASRLTNSPDYRDSDLGLRLAFSAGN